QIVVAAVLTGDLAFVNLLAGAHEQRAALLQIFQRVSGGAARIGRDHDAVHSLRDAAANRLIVIEVVMHDRLAAGRVQEPGAQADQAPGRDGELDVRGLAARVQLQALRPTVADQLHHRTDRGGRYVDDEILNRLPRLAIDFFGNDPRLTDGQLEAFASHVLQQDR